jgi:hypothetical protein
MLNHQLLLFVVLILLVSGCHSGSNTIGISGEVTYDEKPIENGRIDFLPIEGTEGASAGATIVAGKYAIPAEQGLRSDGAYEVRIIGLRKTGRTVQNRTDSGAATVELQENFIPAACNQQSTLKLRAAEMSDKGKVDFQLGKTPVQ